MGNGAGNAGHATLAAWLSLLLVIPCLFLAFLVGEGTISALGYPVGEPAAAPLWAALSATGLAVLVFAIPLLPAWHYGRVARTQGARTAIVPFVVVAVLVTWFLVINVFPLGQ